MGKKKVYTYATWILGRKKGNKWQKESKQGKFSSPEAFAAMKQHRKLLQTHGSHVPIPASAHSVVQELGMLRAPVCPVTALTLPWLDTPGEAAGLYPFGHWP